MRRKSFLRKICFFLVLAIFIFSGYFFTKNAKARGGELSHTSIVPVDYFDPGDTGKYSFDPRFATVQESAKIYMDGSIYIRIYNCTSKGILKFNPGNYILKSFVRLSDGSFIYLPDVDVEDMLNDNSDVKNVWGHEVHKTFDFSPIEIEGAPPKAPNINLTKMGEKNALVTLSGEADWNKTVYSFDYYAVEKGTNKESYVPEEYTKISADDYITGFYYTIDTNRSSNFSYDWDFLTTDDMSGNTTSLKKIIDEEYTCTDVNYYIHVAARSYTGKISNISTKKIMHRQLHDLNYDLNGGEGYIGSQRKIYNRAISVSSTVPRRRGYTFVKWIGEKGEEYYPSDLYVRDQDGGRYTLKAVWRKNKYKIIFDINERNGENGKCNAKNQEYIVDIDTIGFPDIYLKNEIKDEFDCPRFSFMGWMYESKSLHSDINYKSASSVRVENLLERYDLLYEETGNITLYACWDKAPRIVSVKNRYFKDDEIHKITQRELLKTCISDDREDGYINSVKSGYIENFDISDFKLKGSRKGVYVYAAVKDSAENVTKKAFWVYIVDSHKIKAKDNGTEGYIRFIDMENYKKNDPTIINKKIRSRGRNTLIESQNGGLFDDSIWYLDDDYRKSIEKALK